MGEGAGIHGGRNRVIFLSLMCHKPACLVQLQSSPNISISACHPPSPTSTQLNRLPLPFINKQWSPRPFCLGQVNCSRCRELCHLIVIRPCSEVNSEGRQHSHEAVLACFTFIQLKVFPLKKKKKEQVCMYLTQI